MKPISLMYHDVVAAGRYESSGFPGAAANLYKLDRDTFSRHLAAIAGARDVGRTVMDALRDGGDAPVMLTFDDGGASFLYIADELEARGWRGHFFITTDCIGRDGFLGEADIDELHRRGHVVGSHSCSHPERISHCSDEALDHEWRDSVARLESITGGRVTTASVPGGFYSTRVAAAAAAAGIEVLFSSEPTVGLGRAGGCRVFGRFAMERLGATTAGRLAAGARAPRMQQAILWQLKKAAKRVGGRYWFAVRRRMIGR